MEFALTYWDGRRWVPDAPAPPAADQPHRGRDWLATALMLIIGVGLILPFRGAEASAASLTASPAHGLPGARITVTGSGLQPRTTVAVLFGGMAIGMDAVKVSGRGALRVTFRVPQLSPGVHAITAENRTRATTLTGSGYVAATQFTIDAPAVGSTAPSPTATPPSPPTATPTPEPSGTPTTGPTPSATASASPTPPASPTPQPTATTAPTVAPAPTAPPPPPQTGSVTVCGRSLCQAGSPWYLHGASVLGGMDDPASTTGQARSAGLNTIRIVNFLEERGAPATAAYDEWYWARLDRLIADASANGLKVILDLSTYRNMLVNAGVNPYTHDWSAFVAFAANRRNSVTGMRYGDDPTIALVAIAGEIEPINTPDNRLGITTAQVTEFFVRTFAQWRSVDSVHPVTSGGLLHYGWNSGIDWRAIFAAADACSIHNYSPGDVAATPTVAAHCASLNKPWITEEFGWDTSLGDASRAASFQSIYDLNRAYGSAGVAFWNLGQQVQMPTYDVNETTPLTLDVVRRNAH